jgi:hypothetical protein
VADHFAKTSQYNSSLKLKVAGHFRELAQKDFSQRLKVASHFRKLAQKDFSLKLKVASHHGPWELTIPGPYLRRWAPFESDRSLAQGQLPR